ncbi:MAG: ATP-binding protein, partial [Chthoniobacterales bacterium]
ANNEELTAKVRKDFSMIRKNAELEAQLIEDLLDITRISCGDIQLQKRPLDIRDVVEDAIASVQEELDAKKIILRREFRAPATTVFADAARLRQIFGNVLKNAVKFTPHGGGITVETETSPNNTILLKITDTGIGMSADEVTHAFTAFSQGVDGNGRRFGGLGLGLMLAQKLLHYHTGSIHAASAGRGHGATFIIELPLQKCAADKKPEKAPVKNASTSGSAVGSRILLVEDHDPTRIALAQLLTRRNYEVITASSIIEARNLADKQKFDLLIADIGLPDGNGYDLMDELRKEGWRRGIALTGYGMDEDLVRSQNAGFMTHLTKPVSIEALEAALNAAMDPEADELSA